MVFWQDHVNLGIGLLMASSLLMLALLWRDNQWWEREIRRQHIVNEVTLYIICLQLLYFADVDNRLTAIDRRANGIIMVLIVCSNLVYNVVVIVLYAYDRWKLYFVRRKQLIEERDRRKITLAKLNKATSALERKLDKRLGKETQKTWNRQWKKMLARERNYARQVRAGYGYVVIEDYHIETSTEVKEKVKVPLFPELYTTVGIEPVIEVEPVVEEKAEPVPHEAEPLIAPTKMVESEEDENYIAVNIYEQADREAEAALS